MRDQPSRLADRLTHQFPHLCAASSADAPATFENNRSLTPEAAHCLQQVALTALNLFFADTPAGDTGFSSHETQE